MKPPESTDPLAGSLETLAREWRSTTLGPECARAAGPVLDTFRERLLALAGLAQDRDRGADGDALRRIALLTEVWDCLQCDPEQAGATTELATFCADAIVRIARSGPANASDASSAAQWALSQSTARWSDYLGLMGPVADLGEAADSPDAEVEEPLPEPNEPPGFDAQALLRLITGRDGPAEAPGPARHAAVPAPAPSQPPATVPPRPAIRAEASATRAPLSALTVPPLPASVDLDEEIKEAFLADATELFERIENLVVGLSSRGDTRGPIEEIARCFHTLKGAAGSVGLHELATLVHELEERLGEATGRASPALTDSLHQVVGYLDGLIRLLRKGSSAPAESPAPAAGAAAAPVVAPGGGLKVEPHANPVADGPLRVSAARFDELTDLAGELIVQGRFWLAQAESISTFASTLKASRNRLVTSMERLHESGLGRDGRRLRAAVNLQADVPGQLARLGEQADDLTVLVGSAQAAAGTMADRGDTLVRLSRQLWDSFQSLRIVPIRGLFHRLARAIHDAERVEERQVDVVMIGEETGVDRAIQDGAFEPLLHVVRNAIGHGIESPADRERAGKPPRGKVTLEARREGNTLVIAVEDDGKGLDNDAIADKARRLGWLAADDRPTPEQLRAFIFQPGFSTKPQANAISGRGVGMDVVAREVGKLHGTIDLNSQPGRGARVTLRLPSQRALEPSLIVRVGGHGLAVPAAQIECVQAYEPADASAAPPTREAPTTTAVSAGPGPTVVFRDQTIPVVFASDTLGTSPTKPPSWSMLIVVKTGGQPIGLVVDTIEGAEDLIIKPLGALLAGHPLVSGTSVSINGELISVLNPTGLERWLSHREVSEKALTPASPLQQPRRRVRADGLAVLVVDDSISVRRAMARQLRGFGFEVHEVSDGIEALTRLRGSSYGLVVTDLEMPRLDGFALLAEIQRSSALAAIPVVVSSTLSDPQTRRRVLELGARALIAKPVDGRELERTIESLQLRPGRSESHSQRSEARRDG